MKGVPLKPKPSLLCLLPNHYGLVLSINPCSPPQPSSTRCAADSAKGSRQQERRGFRKVSNIRNMSRTARLMFFSLLISLSPLILCFYIFCSATGAFIQNFPSFFCVTFAVFKFAFNKENFSSSQRFVIKIPELFVKIY